MIFRRSFRDFFIIAAAIHTIVPLLVGVILFCSFLFAIDATKHARITNSLGTSDTLHGNVLDDKSKAAIGAIAAVGMVGIIVAVAVAGQFALCLVTSLALTYLAARLIPISTVLYFIVAVVIGTSAAALWFFRMGPGGLQVSAGLLTFFASIGYFLSSLLVCLLPKL